LKREVGSHALEVGPLVEKQIMKKRIQELGNAINETLANSGEIAEAIEKIKSEGYDVFLVLEATVGFNKQEAGNATEVEQEEAGEAEDLELQVNAQDMRFLKSLRISLDEAA
jgi:hypothetical protein